MIETCAIYRGIHQDTIAAKSEYKRGGNQMSVLVLVEGPVKAEDIVENWGKSNLWLQAFL